jgi:hypothetical protein
MAGELNLREPSPAGKSIEIKGKNTRVRDQKFPRDRNPQIPFRYDLVQSGTLEKRPCWCQTSLFATRPAINRP